MAAGLRTYAPRPSSCVLIEQEMELKLVILEIA